MSTRCNHTLLAFLHNKEWIVFSPGSGSGTRKFIYKELKLHTYILSSAFFFFFNVMEVFAGHFKRPCAVKKINESNAINSVEKNTIHAKYEQV